MLESLVERHRADLYNVSVTLNGRLWDYTGKDYTSSLRKDLHQALDLLLPARILSAAEDVIWGHVRLDGPRDIINLAADLVLFYTSVLGENDDTDSGRKSSS